MQDQFIGQIVEGVAIYGFGGGVLLGFCVIAELFLRWQEGQKPIGRETWHNMLLFSVGPIMEGLFANALLIAGLMAFYVMTPLRVPVAWWSLPIYFLVGELGFYWFHRLGHEVRILWADHSIHHSAETYDFTVNLRHTPFSTVYRFITWLPLVLLGFHPVVLVLFAMTAPSFQTFCHTRRIGRLAPWFEWTFVTPSNHAVHHACNPLYLDKNYGGLLMIWDHVFGTYQRLEDEVPPVFGITRPVRTNNVFGVLAHEFRHVARDFAGAPGVRQKLGVLFGKPGKTFEVSRSHHGEAIADERATPAAAMAAGARRAA